MDYIYVSSEKSAFRAGIRLLMSSLILDRFSEIFALFGAVLSLLLELVHSVNELLTCSYELMCC